MIDFQITHYIKEEYYKNELTIRIIQGICWWMPFWMLTGACNAAFRDH